MSVLNEVFDLNEAKLTLDKAIDILLYSSSKVPTFISDELMCEKIRVKVERMIDNETRFISSSQNPDYFTSKNKILDITAKKRYGFNFPKLRIELMKDEAFYLVIRVQIDSDEFIEFANIKEAISCFETILKNQPARTTRISEARISKEMVLDKLMDG